MEEMKNHEKFEIQILDELKKAGFLDVLVFGGGTMMRLCYGLPRFSVDLDFWFSKKVHTASFFKKLLAFLEKKYTVTDSKNKYFTLLFEIKSKEYGRRLKLEIGKEVKKKGMESQIAYSVYSEKQVLVRVFSIEEMGRMKVAAALDRSEIRDFFDLEFLIRRKAFPPIPASQKTALLRKLSRMEKTSYLAVLGSLLDRELREYYRRNGFSFLQDYLSNSRLDT